MKLAARRVCNNICPAAFIMKGHAMKRKNILRSSGMEKKRDPTAKGTDLNPQGIWSQLRKDCHGIGYIRQYRQVLLQAQPDHSSHGARASPAQAHRSLPAVQRRT